MAQQFTQDQERDAFIGFLEESGVQPSEEFRSGDQPDIGLIDPEKTPQQNQVGSLESEASEDEQFGAFKQLLRDLSTPGSPTSTGEFADPATGFESLEQAKTSREAAEQLAAEGVDIETGGPADARLELSLTIDPEERDRILSANFPDGVRMTKAGPVITMREKDGAKREVLLDEQGLSLKDFSDLGGPMLEVLGATGGAVATMAAMPWVVTSALAVPILAVTAGVAGQLGVTAVELGNLWRRNGIDFSKKEDREMLENIIKERGIRAAMDATLDMATAGTARAIKGTVQTGVAPFAKRMSRTPQREILEAADALDVQLSPGKLTGSPTLQRAEAMAERLPGSAPAIEEALRTERKTLRAAQRKALPRAQKDVPLSEDIGKGLNKELRARNKRLEEIATEQDKIRRIADEDFIELKNEQASQRINKKFEELKRDISSRNVDMHTAGDLVRTKMLKEKNDLITKQRVIEGNLDAAEKALGRENSAWVNTKFFKMQAKRLLREIPPAVRKEVTKTGKVKEVIEPNLSFIGTEATLYDVINKLPDRITFKQARNLRNGLFDRLGNLDLFPGMDKGRVKKMASESVKMIRRSIRDAPNAKISRLAKQSQEEWAKNILPFEIGIIKRGLREEIEGSFVVQSENLLPYLLLNGRRGDAAKVMKMIGEESPTAKAVRRSVFSELVERHKLSSFEGDVVNAKSLQKEFRKLNAKGTGQMILGKEDKAFNRLLRFAAARQGLLRIPDIKKLPPDANIRDLLIQAVQREAQSQKDTQIKMAQAAIKNSFPDIKSDEKFVFNMMQQPLEKIERVWKFASDQQKQDFRERLITNMLELSSQSRELADRVISVKNLEASLGTTMSDIMGSFAFKDTAQSIKKLNFVLGDDQLKILRQLGFVQAAEKQGRDAASAVGGISAGMTISSLITGGQGSAPITKIGKWWVAAKLMNNPVTRKWLLNKRQLKNPTIRSRTLQAIIPQLGRAASQEFGESSEIAQDINSFLDSPQFIEAFTPK